MPSKFTIELLFALFKGIAFLHSLNLVHNDLKPANILLTDSFEYVVLANGYFCLRTQNVVQGQDCRHGPR